MITIIVFTDQVGILVKSKLMRIAVAVSKYFKITSVRVTPGYHAAIRVLPFLSVLVFTAKTNVADLPVYPAIGTHFHSRHTVTAKPDVNAISMRHRCFFIGYTVTIFIQHSPHIWSYGNVQVFSINQHPAGNIRYFVMKIVYHQLCSICHAITIYILHFIHLFCFNGHVFPVVGAIFIYIFQPFIFFAVFRR